MLLEDYLATHPINPETLDAMVRELHQEGCAYPDSTVEHLRSLCEGAYASTR